MHFCSGTETLSRNSTACNCCSQLVPSWTLRTEGEQTGASLNYSREDFQQSLALPGVVLEVSPGRQHYTRSDCHLQGSPGTGPARILREHTGTEVVTKTKGSCRRVVAATNSTKALSSLPASLSQVKGVCFLAQPLSPERGQASRRAGGAPRGPALQI